MSSIRALYAAACEQERQRLAFIRSRDGEKAVSAFCRQLLATYRPMVVKRLGPAADRQKRIRFIASVQVAKDTLGPGRLHRPTRPTSRHEERLHANAPALQP